MTKQEKSFEIHQKKNPDLVSFNVEDPRTTSGSGLRYLKSLVYSWTQDPDKIVKKFSIQGPRILIKIVNKLSI